MSSTPRWLLTIAVLVLVIAGWQFASGQQRPVPGQATGRFQMEADGNVIHIMDTTNGQVWTYGSSRVWQQLAPIPRTGD